MSWWWLPLLVLGWVLGMMILRGSYDMFRPPRRKKVAKRAKKRRSSQNASRIMT